MALETQFTASNLTNYAVFSNTQLREYKTSEEYIFSDRKKAIRHQARDPDQAEQS